jgi:hypothetical protein
MPALVLFVAVTLIVIGYVCCVLILLASPIYVILDHGVNMDVHMRSVYEEYSGGSKRKQRQ